MEQRAHEHYFSEGVGLVPRPERLRKVLIVGAGVAGLQTARQFLRLGCQVLVLEINDEVGGVWIRNYIGFGLQVPWRMYQFPEFPWPKDLQPSSDYPTGQEVQEYVRAYCREYNLRTCIRFNCKLLRLRWCAGSRQWDALYCDTVKEKFFKVTVDYTVICAGIYSQPYIPDYEGTNAYAGIQLHAKDFVDLSLARGRRVVIVGAGKTALDCVSSIVATNTATSVTLLYRQAHWPLPRRMLGTSVRRLLFNRAMTTMMPPYYTAGRTAHMTNKLTSPIKNLFWRSMESIISRKFHITDQMRPRVHLPADLFYGGQILDNTMDKLIRSEALVTVKGEINRFVRNGVILQDGNFVAADLVLYCTGYLKTYEYLEGDMRARLDLQKDGLYLYRNCLPYAVPHLAFIGSEVSTYNNILTDGLQALWLGHVLTGRCKLPPVAEMVEDVRAQQRWRRSVMPAQRSRGSVLMVYMMQYHDQLLEDMGQRPQRKGLNVMAECFGAYTAYDYRALLEQDDLETMAARQKAEEQLIAAGVPPAVLAAAGGGRTGVVTSTSHPSKSGGTAGAANGAGGHAGGNSAIYSSGGGSAAAAARGGGTGGGGEPNNASAEAAMAEAAMAEAAMAEAARYGCLHSLGLDDQAGSSIRTGTSASTRSVGPECDSYYRNTGLEPEADLTLSKLQPAQQLSSLPPPWDTRTRSETSQSSRSHRHSILTENVLCTVQGLMAVKSAALSAVSATGPIAATASASHATGHPWRGTVSSVNVDSRPRLPTSHEVVGGGATAAPKTMCTGSVRVSWVPVLDGLRAHSAHQGPAFARVVQASSPSGTVPAILPQGLSVTQQQPLLAPLALVPPAAGRGCQSLSSREALSTVPPVGPLSPSRLSRHTGPGSSLPLARLSPCGRAQQHASGSVAAGDTTWPVRQMPWGRASVDVTPMPIGIQASAGQSVPAHAASYTVSTAHAETAAATAGASSSQQAGSAAAVAMRQDHAGPGQGRAEMETAAGLCSVTILACGKCVGCVGTDGSCAVSSCGQGTTPGGVGRGGDGTIVGRPAPGGESRDVLMLHGTALHSNAMDHHVNTAAHAACADVPASSSTDKSYCLSSSDRRSTGSAESQSSGGAGGTARITKCSPCGDTSITALQQGSHVQSPQLSVLASNLDGAPTPAPEPGTGSERDTGAASAAAGRDENGKMQEGQGQLPGGTLGARSREAPGTKLGASDLISRSSARESRRPSCFVPSTGAGSEVSGVGRSSGVSLSRWSQSPLGVPRTAGGGQMVMNGDGSPSAASASAAASGPIAAGRSASTRRTSSDIPRRFLARLPEEGDGGSSTPLTTDDSGLLAGAADRSDMPEPIQEAFCGQPQAAVVAGAAAAAGSAAVASVISSGFDGHRAGGAAADASRSAVLSPGVASAAGGGAGGVRDVRRLTAPIMYEPLPPPSGVPVGQNGTAADSDIWSRLFPGAHLVTTGGCSPGSSSLLVDSNISLAAGLGAASGMFPPSIIGGGGGNAYPSPDLYYQSLSRLSRSHTFGDMSVSCSLGNWVGNTSAACGSVCAGVSEEYPKMAEDGGSGGDSMTAAVAVALAAAPQPPPQPLPRSSLGSTGGAAVVVDRVDVSPVSAAAAAAAFAGAAKSTGLMPMEGLSPSNSTDPRIYG